MDQNVIVALSTFALGSFATGLAFVFRLEGKMNVFQAILDRVEKKVDVFEQRYNLDGEYFTVRQRMRGHEPAE